MSDGFGYETGDSGGTGNTGIGIYAWYNAGVFFNSGESVVIRGALAGNMYPYRKLDKVDGYEFTASTTSMNYRITEGSKITGHGFTMYIFDAAYILAEALSAKSYISMTMTDRSSHTVTGMTVGRRYRICFVRTDDFGTILNYSVTFTPPTQASGNTYTVKFDANGGTGYMAPQTGTVGGERMALRANTFTRTYYRFLGWSMTSGGRTVNYADEGIVWSSATGTYTLYAVWRSQDEPIPESTYDILLDANGGSVSGQATVSVPIKQGTSTSQAGAHRTVTRAGYRLVGWYDTSASSGGNMIFDWNGYAADGEYWNGSYSPGVSSATWRYAGTVTAYARWMPVAYTVTFYGDGQTLGRATVELGKSTNQAVASRYKPTREGYALSGWYDKDGNVMFDSNGYAADGMYWDGDYWPGSSSATWEHAENVTAYAHWIAAPIQQYTVTLNANGGSVSGQSTVSVQVEQGKNTNQAGAHRTVTRAGYRLAGWYDTSASSGGSMIFDANGYAVSGSYWNGSYSPNVSSATWRFAGSVTAYARWIPNTCTVTFYGGGKTLGTAKMEMGKNTCQAAASAYKPTREGYVLTGWYDASGKIMFDAQGRAVNGKYWNGSYVKGTSSATWKFAGNVTAYAHWTPAPVQKCTVTFYGGGKTLGTATMETGKNTNQAAASLYKPTRAGYRLIGWGDKDGKIIFDAQGRAANGDYWNGSYVKGSSSATWKFAGNVTAYAYWEEVPVQEVPAAGGNSYYFTITCTGSLVWQTPSVSASWIKLGGTESSFSNGEGTIKQWYSVDANTSYSLREGKIYGTASGEYFEFIVRQYGRTSNSNASEVRSASRGRALPVQY